LDAFHVLFVTDDAQESNNQLQGLQN